jgi:hypothetical protein
MASAASGMFLAVKPITQKQQVLPLSITWWVVGIMHGDVLHEHDAARVSMMNGGTNVPLLQRWLLLHVAVSCCMWHVARAVMLHGVGAAGEALQKAAGELQTLYKETAFFPFLTR